MIPSYNVRVSTATTDTFGPDDEILICKGTTAAAIAVPNLVRINPNHPSTSRIAWIKNDGTAPVVINNPAGTIEGVGAFTIPPGRGVAVAGGSVAEYTLIATDSGVL
jgi:hypothetical protein